MSDLTAAQAKKKAEVEAAGGTFVPPSQYKEMMKGKKSASTPRKKAYNARSYGAGVLRTDKGAVAAVSAYKKYPRQMRELSPDSAVMVEQMLNPDASVDQMRWPNTYGLSAIYKCNTIINPNFSVNKKCCVVVNPTVRDSIFTTAGTVLPVTLYPFATIEDAALDDPNPYSSQSFDLSSTTDGAWWSSPIILPSREALLPLPSSQASALVYPVNFSFPSTATQNIMMGFRFNNAISNQGQIFVNLYDENFKSLLVNPISSYIGNITDPAGVGTQVVLLEPASTYIDDIEYMSIYVNGTNVSYYGNVDMWIYQPSDSEDQATLSAPNHEQHVVIQDIKDADTIDASADQAFVVSQSTLITSNFSDLQNGGVIAIARIPGAAVVGGGDLGVDANSWYDWISSLSNNQYDGAIKHGAYSWYLPEDETGFFYRPISSYATKQLPYVVSEFSTTDTSITALGIRVKVTTIVQFTTTSSVYSCAPSARIDEALYMHHLLSLVKASYSNGGHIAGLKQSLKNIGGNVIKLLKNPKTYSTAAEIIGGLAA